MGEEFSADRPYLLENTIQHYAWGSPTAIPELLGRTNPDGEPQAELWMGAHPKAPSRLLVGNRPVPLTELLARNPIPLLGKAVADRFGARFPFLFKVLAAANALSIQAHPNLLQAREGYRREEAAGVPRDAPGRNYRDDNHKPEVLCALGDFWGLRGFRPVEEMLRDITLLEVPLLSALSVPLLADGGPEGLRAFLRRLLEMGAEEARSMTDKAAARCYGRPGERFRWVGRLAAQFPGDVGVVAPLFLNLIRLRPGEAIYQKAGELHAYLEGTGIELMANSDNVLRGGLTTKHIDVPELMKILSFEIADTTPIHPRRLSDATEVYDTPSSEFRLSHLSVSRYESYSSGQRESVELLLCVEGSALLRWTGSPPGELRLDKGQSALVPAALSAYDVVGEAELFRADVPPESRAQGGQGS